MAALKRVFNERYKYNVYNVLELFNCCRLSGYMCSRIYKYYGRPLWETGIIASHWAFMYTKKWKFQASRAVNDLVEKRARKIKSPRSHLYTYYIVFEKCLEDDTRKIPRNPRGMTSRNIKFVKARRTSGIPYLS